MVITTTTPGLGDTLLISIVVRQLALNHHIRSIVVSKWSELFENNPHLAANIGLPHLGFIAKPLVKAFVRHVRGCRVMRFGYRAGESVPREVFLAEHSRPVSLFQLCAERLPFELDFRDPHCEVFFSDAETEAFVSKFRLPPKFALVKPTGKTSWTSNKEWGAEKFQAVVSVMPDIAWVQIGEESEPLLEGCVDLRGQTGIREVLWLLSRASLVLSTEGFYNHAASAFGTPSFTVFSGLHLADIATYSNTIPIVRDPPTPCTPCWISGPCPVPGKPCTEDIRPEQVVAAIRRYFSTFGNERLVAAGGTR